MMLRLYVWEGILTDWTDGIAFALAWDADHARSMLIESGCPADELTKEPDCYDGETPMAIHLWGGS
jgi:hypothetical protein